ncbi:hypothetical protein [Streptomyces adonidis]|uniref:hypothetical protein n=1 Tax=Streptomyces adonidis TaxID=3231367 RepID=UPI0034DB4AC2
MRPEETGPGSARPTAPSTPDATGLLAAALICRQMPTPWQTQPYGVVDPES